LNFQEFRESPIITRESPIITLGEQHDECNIFFTWRKSTNKIKGGTINRIVSSSSLQNELEESEEKLGKLTQTLIERVDK